MKKNRSVLWAKKIFFLGMCVFISASVFSQSNDYGIKINVAAKVRHRDATNKIVYSDYKEFPTQIVDNLSGFKPMKKTQLDIYGGNITLTIKNTEFFQTKKIGDRWWCIDPLGHPYINMAVNSINKGSSERNEKAFEEKYKTTETWIDSTSNLLHNLGFNCAGSWSDTKTIISLNKSANIPLAYTINWNFMSLYGKERGGTYQVPGHTGYPGNVIFVFDPGFEDFCDKLAQQLSQFKEDKNLFGYFSDNEMPFNIKNLEGYLSLPKDDYGHIAAEKWLVEKHINEYEITDQNRKDFLAFEAGRYFSIVSKAIKKYDSNHLYLGSRLYSSEKNIPEFMKAAGKYIDLLSINYYGAWTPSQQSMNNWTAWSGKPFIITEYYVKGEDSGLPNVSGAGWIVKTQEDRGDFYQNFCLGLLQSKNCVGWHWFKYQDNDPAQKNVESSNNDANKGIVDNDYNVYQALAIKMKQLNLNSYTLINFFDDTNQVDSSFDLYLLIGQSNMSGRGLITGKFKDEGNPDVFMLTKENTWVPAKNPLHFDKPKVVGVGPGLSFGIAMQKANPKHKIGLIPCAVGGTSIDTWKPGGYDEHTKTHPYDDMLSHLQVALQSGVLKGVIWLQGEADSKPDKATVYLPKLEELIRELREVAGNPNLPFVAGELGRYREQYQNINKVLKDLPAKVPYTAVASSKGLTDKGDKTHFNSASQEKMGKRMAKKMKMLQKEIKKRSYKL